MRHDLDLTRVALTSDVYSVVDGITINSVTPLEPLEHFDPHVASQSRSVAPSPSRILDRSTAAIDAMLTAAMGAMDTEVLDTLTARVL
jgi:hypothetical protein